MMLYRLRRSVDMLELAALDICETRREEDMILRCGRGETDAFKNTAVGMAMGIESSKFGEFYKACVALAEAEKRELAAAFAPNL